MTHASLKFKGRIVGDSSSLAERSGAFVLTLLWGLLWWKLWGPQRFRRWVSLRGTCKLVNVPSEVAVALLAFPASWCPGGSIAMFHVLGRRHWRSGVTEVSGLGASCLSPCGRKDFSRQTASDKPVRSCFMGTELPSGMTERSGLDGGDGCTTVWMYLII